MTVPTTILSNVTNAVTGDPATTAALPHLSTWLFYVGNILLITAYLVITLLVLRPGGLSGRGYAKDSTTVTTVTVLFFCSCALLHIELALEAYTHGPIDVDPHLTAVVWVKVILVVWGALAIHRVREAHLNRETARIDAIITDTQPLAIPPQADRDGDPPTGRDA